MRVDSVFCCCEVPFMMVILVWKYVNKERSSNASPFVYLLPPDHVIYADGDTVENFQLISSEHKTSHLKTPGEAKCIRMRG
jgi:hypothetical protein